MLRSRQGSQSKLADISESEDEGSKDSSRDEEEEHNEAQRRELLRLLGTAKDDDRRRVVLSALAALDESKDGPSGTVSSNPSLLNEVKRLTFESSSANAFVKSSSSDRLPLVGKGLLNASTLMAAATATPGRPMSARFRRPSMSLDVIPENHFMMDRVLEKDREIELVEHDINYICSSSHDPRYPPSAKLLVPHSRQIGWVSTGLLPQVMCINLSSTWVFRKIVVRCFGTESLGLSVPSLSRILEMERINANDYVFDVKVSTDIITQPPKRSPRGGKSENDESTSSLDVLWGNQILLTFRESSSDFVGVFGITVIVVPHSVTEREPINPPAMKNSL